MIAYRQSFFAELAGNSAPEILSIAMKTYLTIAQIAVSTVLVIAILLQSRGTGLGSAFGGEGNVYRTKRGVEKILFRSTIVFAVAFLGLAFASVMLPQA